MLTQPRSLDDSALAMQTTREYLKIYGVVLGAALAVSTGGCASDTECGTGTTEVDGTCVPTDSVCGENSQWDDTSKQCVGQSVCAAGTSLMGNECVPDGSVICETGTTWAEGKCVADITGCATGTVLVAGECVPFDETLTGDIVEAPEPNDVGDTPGMFALPAVGEHITIEGCVNPTVDSDEDGQIDPDFDAYVFSVAGPTLIDVTVDGVGGLTGGLQVLATDPTIADTGWTRIGVDLVGDTAKRQVYLPAAGAYALLLTDGRSIVSGLAAGGKDTCYFATVENVAIPAPTPLVDNAATGVLGATVDFYSYEPISEGAILFPTVTAPSDSAAAGVVTMVSDTFRNANGFAGFGAPAAAAVMGLTSADSVAIAVDSLINFSISEVSYDLLVGDPGAAPATDDGNPITLSYEQDADGNSLFDFVWFEATAGDVLHLEFSGENADEFTALLLAPEFSLVTEFCGDELFGCPAVTALDEWVQITTTGRHYLRLANNSGTVGEDYNVTVTRTHVQPTQIVGPQSTPDSISGTLGEDGFAWYEFDATSAEWWTFVNTTTDIADLRLTMFDRSAVGAIGIDVSETDSIDADDAIESGRIYLDDDNTYLLRISDAGGDPVDGNTYQIDIADRQFTRYDNLVEGTPLDVDAFALVEGENYFILTSAEVPGSRLTLQAAPAATDITVAQLDNKEASGAVIDNGAAGEAESLSVIVAETPPWIAVRINATVADTADLDVSVRTPVTYTPTEGTLPFVDICDGTTRHALRDFSFFDPEDEGISVAPISLAGLTTGFSLFGEEVTELWVNSNGVITADGTQDPAGWWANGSLPSVNAPLFAVMPFWDDLELALDSDSGEPQVCVLAEADKITVQFVGRAFADGAVEFQAVFHDGTNVVDYIYGPNHASTGSSATVGMQGSLGISGSEFCSLDTCSIAPSTSVTYTPDTPSS